MANDWLNVSGITPRIAYTATAGQTLFTVPFIFFDSVDLLVYQNEVLLTLGTNYTVSGAEASNGGVVTLLVGATLGDAIAIVRDVAIIQTTHFPPSGPFDIAAANFQNSKLIAIDQQLSDRIDRSVHLATSDPTAGMEVPDIAARASKMWAWDSLGSLVATTHTAEEFDSVLTGALSVAGGFGKVNIIGTLAGLKALTPFAGAVVNIQGGTTANDGGEGTFNWNASSTATPDDNLIVQPNAGGVGRWVRQSSITKVISEDYIDVRAHFGILFDGSYADGVRFQTALDNAPVGSTLCCPPGLVATSVPLVLSRPINIKMDPMFSLRGDFAGHSSYDVLQIAITDTSGGGDVRSMIIEGGRIYTNGGGNCAININPSAAYLPHFETIIRNGSHNGNFRCIRIGGGDLAGDTNFNTIEGCNLGVQAAGGAAVDLDGCADGNRILNNLIFGPGTGVRVNVVSGAFNTIIQGNGIVNRDGAVLVTNGSRVLIDSNQIEQTGGTNGLSASIYIQGLSYKSAGCIITRNSFGGGPNVNYNIRIDNGHHAVIDLNQICVAAIVDVALVDAGAGVHADYNTIGGNNTFRGGRAIQQFMTDANRRMVISEASACVGNRGIWKPGSALTFSNGWASDNLAYFVDENSILRWEGNIVGGTLTAGTAITTMSAWARPINKSVLKPVATASNLGILTFAPSGAVAVGGINMPNIDVGMSGISYPVNWMDTYDVGP